MTLSAEDISARVAEMDFRQAQEFLRSLSADEVHSFGRHACDGLSKYVAEDAKKCLVEHACSLNTFYDIEHPSD